MVKVNYIPLIQAFQILAGEDPNAQIMVYVGTLESGEYEDYRMSISGVFASLEDAQVAFSQAPVEVVYYEPGKAGARYEEWSEWEVNNLGVLWTQRLGWGGNDRRTITQTFIGEVWNDE